MAAKYVYATYDKRLAKLHKNYNHKRRLKGQQEVSYEVWRAGFKPARVTPAVHAKALHEKNGDLPEAVPAQQSPAVSPA